MNSIFHSNKTKALERVGLNKYVTCVAMPNKFYCVDFAKSEFEI